MLGRGTARAFVQDVDRSFPSTPTLNSGYIKNGTLVKTSQEKDKSEKKSSRPTEPEIVPYRYISCVVKSLFIMHTRQRFAAIFLFQVVQRSVFYQCIKTCCYFRRSSKANALFRPSTTYYFQSRQTQPPHPHPPRSVRRELPPPPTTTTTLPRPP